MNEATKQAYMDKMSSQMKEWNAKFEVLKAKGSTVAAEVRIDFNKQLEGWEKRKAELSGKLEELGSAGMDRFEALKAGAESMWVELKGFVENIGENKGK